MVSEKGVAGLWGLVSFLGDFYSSRVATFRALILRSPVSPLNMNQSRPLIKLVPNPISFINFVIRVGKFRNSFFSRFEIQGDPPSNTNRKQNWSFIFFRSNKFRILCVKNFAWHSNSKQIQICHACNDDRENYLRSIKTLKFDMRQQENAKLDLDKKYSNN